MIEALVNLVIYIVILGAIFWLLDYIIGVIPMADPFRRIARIVLTVVACLILIAVLLQLVQGGGYKFMRIT